MKKGIILAALLSGIAFCYAFLPAGKQEGHYSFSGAPKTVAQLGEVLFFEKKLSRDATLSCSSCHIPAYAFADTVAFSRGINGQAGKRNAPSCANLSDRSYFFYDGRAATLEKQVRFPIEDKREMGYSITEAVKRLQKDPGYKQWFATIFHAAPSVMNLELSIAAFERTLETSKTPFDRYMNDDTTAMSESAIRGRELFMSSKAKCFDCHFSPDFTGDEFRNIGLFDGGALNDSGRYLISGNPADIGKFKVPGLRNVAVTAPYMHNGMFGTLRQVIDYYDDPYKVVHHPVNTDSLLLQPLHLTEQEKTDLEHFLVTLTDDRFAAALPHHRQ